MSLATADVKRMLEAGAGEISAELLALPDEVLSWHPAEGEWCLKECLGHLIEAERRGFAGRIRMLLEADGEPPLEGWDQVAVQKARDDCHADRDALLREFADLREASLTLLAALGPEDLQRAGVHDFVGRLSVGEIISEWVHHDRNHFKQMLTNVQDYAWQTMGAARKFSQPH